MDEKQQSQQEEVLSPSEKTPDPRPQEEQEGYVPRSPSQIWAARIGLVVFILFVIWQIYQIYHGFQ